MSNNTSNYQEYTFPKLLEQYDKMLVPMIQRDYAQGRLDKKATDVRKNLLNDIFSGNEVHFDLVFGSVERRIVDGAEKRCFIPVDGQQRLTTLFLLYLYGQRQLGLYQEVDLSKFSYDTRRAASDFCKSVTSEEWIIQEDKSVSEVIKDASWYMEYWAKDPTVEGMLNMLDAIHEKTKEKGYPNLENVKFYFFDLESNGLNENLYLKMNSRGKPLTAFENLKAKIEKVLPDNIVIDEKYFPECDAAPKDSSKEKWKFFMDRDWTETFWDEDHPEKYDESITKFIVRFLSGYWAAYGTDEEQMANDLKSLNGKDSYADFIPFEPIKKVLDLEYAFPKLAYALTTITEDSKITPYWCGDNNRIDVLDKSEYKLLAVVVTYVLFDGDKPAMRFAWNIAENYVSGYNNFITYCKRAKEIHNKYKPEENNAFYKTLSNNGFNDPSNQLKEEIAKGQQILDENGGLRKYIGSCKKEDGTDYQTWEEIIIEAEKYAFFKGAIRFLFTDGEGYIKWCDFDTKWCNIKRYFDEKGEIVKKYKTNAILLRALLSRINIGENWFGYYKEFWHTSLLNSNYRSAVHYLLITSKLEIDENCEQNWVTDDCLLQNLLACYDRWHILTNWKGFNVLTRYSQRRSDATSYKEIVVLNDLRNSLLNNDNIEIIPEAKVDHTTYLYGLDINFGYNGHKFQWNTDEKVYLLEGGIRKIKTENEYYFADVTNLSTSQELINKLDCLIHQAEADKKSEECYLNCQNKICK